VTGDELHALAVRLAGEDVSAPETVRGGGNNRLYRVAGSRGAFALKHYPADPADARARYEREFGGLRFLWEQGVRCIPQPLGLEAGSGVALYGWIEGGPIGQATADDIEALAAFARRLHELRRAPGARALPEAREAVGSATELHAQLAARLTRLAGPAAEHPALGALVRDIAAEAALRQHAGADAPLPRERQTLSPSDFGFHNAIRTPEGLAFVDFEYFGWDDPVKLVADVLWHPGMALDEGQRQKFYGGVAEVYGVDADFKGRFERDVPLYGLRWALIVLNEFLPGIWERRVAAGQPDDRRAALERQLAKAAGLLDRVRRNAVLA
jgi:hypothetical protein